MILLLIICMLAIAAVIIMDIWASWILSSKPDVPAAIIHPLPAVAVLLPCRNEEEHLPACIQSLLRLDYPHELITILVGNDASTDSTLAIAQEWSKQHARIKVVDVWQTVGTARGKANVLAQLVHACPPEVAYLFMTDADIRPNPQWIRRMLSAQVPGIGLVNGTTLVRGNSLFDRWQQTDWAIALGLGKAYTYLPKVGKTLSAIGNNMLITREAYSATGGYEAIPFSITEDYELLQQIRKHGYEAVHLMDAPSSALTEPIRGLFKLLHQRKRWMTGAMRLPLPMVVLLFLQALFFPAIIVVLLMQPLLGMLALALKIGVQYLMALQILKRLGSRDHPRAGLGYELYSCLLSILLITFYFLPITINWKERTYRTNRA